MKVIFFYLLKSLVALLVVIVLLASGLFALISQPSGQIWLMQRLFSFSDGKIDVRELRGSLPGMLEADEIGLADDQGVWLHIEHPRMVWSLQGLWQGHIDLEQLSAQRIELAHWQSSTDSTVLSDFSIPLPPGLTVSVRDMHVDQVMLNDGVIGPAMRLMLQGQGSVSGGKEAELKLSVQRLDMPGDYRLDVASDADHVQVKLMMREQRNGLLAQALKTGALIDPVLALDLNGSWTQAQIQGALASGVSSTPLLRVTGSGALGPEVQLDLMLNLPDLKTLAGLSGIALQGSATSELHVKQQPQAIYLDAGVTLERAGMENWLGTHPRLTLSMAIQSADLQIEHFELANAPLALQASGRLAAGALQLDGDAKLAQTDKLLPGLKASLAAQWHLAGAFDALTMQSRLTLKPEDQKSVLTALAPLKLDMDLQNKAGALTGTLQAHGAFDGAPLEALTHFQQQKNRTFSLNLAHLIWRSTRLKAQMLLPEGAQQPLVATVEAAVSRLEDYNRILGTDISGALSAHLENCAGTFLWCLRAEGKHISALSASLQQLDLNARLASQRIQTTWTLHHAAWADVTADATLTSDGPPDNLALQISAQLEKTGGRAIRLDSRAQWLAPPRRLRLLEFAASELKSDPALTLKLLQPADFRFAPQIEVDSLKLGLGHGVLELAGRLAPLFDINAAVHDVDLSLLQPWVPDYALQGLLQADMHLHGQASHPDGHVQVRLERLHAGNAPFDALPPVQLNAGATLLGDQADVSAQFNLDKRGWFSLSGRVPWFSSASSELKLAGEFDLDLLNARLMAQGRQFAGRLTLDSVLSGTLEQPELNGALELAGGDIKDYRQGMHLSDINGKIRLENGKARIASFNGKAGNGDFNLSGELGWREPAMPVDVHAHFKQAQLFSSDRLSVNLNADLALQGRAEQGRIISGTVFLNRVDIGIPERLPTKIAVLQFREPGSGHAPQPAPAPAWQGIKLNMAIAAPHAIFVRGRGVYAELGGTLKLAGDLKAPITTGGFNLHRGQYSLVGKTLVLSSGTILFDGVSVTDPVLHLVAGVNNATAASTLTITGNASKPEIVLQSVPPLPQEEILAQILFGGSVSTLSPLDMAQMGVAVASMTSGAGSNVSRAVDKVRQGLGLDRLGVGSNTQGATLEAGRYLLPGLYLGAQQGLTGSGTQGVVQFDVTEHLKLEGALGTSPQNANTGGNSTGTSKAGIIYQMEY